MNFNKYTKFTPVDIKTNIIVLVVLVALAVFSAPSNAANHVRVSVGGTVVGSNGYITGGITTGYAQPYGTPVSGLPTYGYGYTQVPVWNSNPYYRVPVGYSGRPINVGCGVGRYCSKGIAGQPVGIFNMNR